MHDYLRFLVQRGILIQALIVSKYHTFGIFLKPNRKVQVELNENN